MVDKFRMQDQIPSSAKELEETNISWRSQNASIPAASLSNTVARQVLSPTVFVPQKLQVIKDHGDAAGHHRCGFLQHFVMQNAPLPRTKSLVSYPGHDDPQYS